MTVGYENKDEIRNLKNEAIHKYQGLLLLNAESGTSHYPTLPDYNQVRENVRLKIVELHAHIIVAACTETTLQLQLSCNTVSAYGQLEYSFCIWCSVNTPYSTHSTDTCWSEGAQHTLHHQVV